jgi:co-chaperonin GroES (HSP10)
LPDPTKEKVGSLFLPDQAKNIPTIGTILSSGEPSNNKKLFGQARDRIIYGKYAGINYNAGDDSEYKIILDAEILCKIKVD